MGIDDLDHEMGIDDLDHEMGIDDLDHEMGIDDLDHEMGIDDLHHEMGIDDLFDVCNTWAHKTSATPKYLSPTAARFHGLHCLALTVRI